MPSHAVVSRERWLEARKTLLARERELTHLRDAISAQRRELPWVKVEKNYLFDTSTGQKRLAELFEQRGQLIVYHLMFGPGWEEACPSCAYLMDHVDGMLPHLEHRDVTFTAVSRAPLADIEKFKRRMGWKFNWASSYGSDFNYDYGVSFTKADLAKGKVFYNYEDMKAPPFEEFPGLSAFIRDGNDVFHTYSTYARGLDAIVGTYQYLDLAPKGRDEDGLDFSMAWVRYHDRYGPDYKLDPKQGYVPPKGAVCEHCAGK
jgi:predicted dithiol-disulfide oxidoreductase (DUF899 family)